jgi:hypothetical protein
VCELSAPDFKDVPYDPQKPNGRTASDDAETCVNCFCRMPITSLAIVGGLVFGVGYLMLSGNLLLQFLGILVVLAVFGGLYYRFKNRKSTILH